MGGGPSAADSVKPLRAAWANRIDLRYFNDKDNFAREPEANNYHQNQYKFKSKPSQAITHAEKRGIYKSQIIHHQRTYWWVYHHSPELSRYARTPRDGASFCRHQEGSVAARYRARLPVGQVFYDLGVPCRVSRVDGMGRKRFETQDRTGGWHGFSTQ